MKLTLLALLLATQTLLAQTLKEQRTKEEMLERVDTLITKVDEAREKLAADDVAGTCDSIKEIFRLYPAHLSGIGQHMNMLAGKTSKLKDVVLQELIFFHQQSNACASKNHENVAPKQLKKQLKSVAKSLGKQKRVITKKDTDYSNYFEYHYEF